MSTCAKPGCAGSATTVLSYQYAGAIAVLEDPAPGPTSPHVYALCSSCAKRLQPPRGWTLEDHRARPPLFLTEGDRQRAPVSSRMDDLEEETETESRQLFFGQSA